MKLVKIFVLIMSMFLFGCVLTPYNSPPKNESSVVKKVSYRYDEFQKIGWLETEEYLAEIENGWNAGITHHYRAQFNEQGDLNTIQLYMILMANEWYFINDIRDSNGNAYNFVKIDSEVFSGGAIHEHFAITISKEQLLYFSSVDKKFKVLGKRNSGVFSVSKYLSSAFLKRLNQQLDTN